VQVEGTAARRFRQLLFAPPSRGKAGHARWLARTDDVALMGNLRPVGPSYSWSRSREMKMPELARILVVEDDLHFLGTLSAALVPSFEVVQAQTGAAALDQIRRRRPDLVLLDYVLPDVPGLAVLRTAKKLFPSIPVILMTGHGSESISVEAFRSGARDYFKKPFSLLDLLGRIGVLLEVRTAQAKRRPPLPLGAKADLGRDAPQAAPDPRIVNLQRALAFIEAHFDSDLMLDQVAREAGMSKFHFCRAFKQFRGQGFREYLAQFRIARAMELLRDRSRSVTEVCYDVGFNDLTHFARTFRRLTGHSPSIYRQSFEPLPGGISELPPAQ
jgi:YesN/AraC family two-component response regulator